MTIAEENRSESRPFEADVAKLLQLMVHSVYSEKSVFLRELISNAADACERLRYEAIAEPALLGDDPTPRITITVDAEQRQLMIEDNGIGMSREELIESLGTIARSGTKAFIDRLEAARGRRGDGADRPLRRRLLLGLHGGRARRGVLPPRRHRHGACSGLRTARARLPWRRPRRPMRRAAAPASCCISWRTPSPIPSVPRSSGLSSAQSGHVPVPIAIIEKPGAEAAEITDGAALWAKPKS